MLPIDYYRLLWGRCDQLSAIHAYLNTHAAPIIETDELLRAEWVARVSSLDLYIHEKIAQRMLDIFEGRYSPSAGFMKLQVSNDLLMQIRLGALPVVQGMAFDLEVRKRLGVITYQDPEKIADGIRLISDVELWNEIAIKQGATQSNKIDKAKNLKKDMSLIVERRNKIAHEGDLKPGVPRTPWPINQSDLFYVATFIDGVVNAIELII